MSWVTSLTLEADPSQWTRLRKALLYHQFGSELFLKLDIIILLLWERKGSLVLKKSQWDPFIQRSIVSILAQWFS